MSICVVTDSGTQVPTHLQRIPIPQLSLSSACSDAFVKAKVLKKFHLVSTEGDYDYVLKAVIQEYEDKQNLPSGFTSINTILFGPLAKDFSQTVAEGDLLVLAGFTVGRSPTVRKDGLHPCNLQLAGGDVHVYVYPASTLGPDTVSTRITSTITEAAKSKYVYVALKDLKAGMIVNVYGVVTFFKQPFRTRGTDYCSTLKITDQSDAKLGCSIFQKLEDLPQIYKVGDIVRLHRVKAQLFNGTVNAINTLGFSAMTFDGTIGSPIVPRTSQKCFSFSDEDKQKVETLRAWAAEKSALPPKSGVPLSSVRPKMYFDLTCQLLAKAKIDNCCTLLKVWDGTVCGDPLLSVSVEQDALEGSLAAAAGRQNLVASVLAFDDHVEVAQSLKPGSYIRIYNLHAVAQSAEMSAGVGGAGGADGASPLVFHLHCGTSYSRGIRTLPDDSPDLQELKGRLESLDNDLSDSSLLEWCTPPEFPVADPENCLTVRTCDHVLEHVTLACVKNSPPPGVFHTRVRLQSYQPERLYQALKLHCPKCKALQDVPDEDAIVRLFQQALSGTERCSELWAFTGHLNSCDPGRKISLHLCRSVGSKDLIFVEGSTFEEMCRMSGVRKSMVPVRSSDGRMTLLSLSAPFLFQGPKRYYGCTHCSQVKYLEVDLQDKMKMNEQRIAEVLGVQPLQYVFLMKMTLEDDSGCLDALLWTDSECFFHVPASDAEASQELQDWMRQALDKLCPPGGCLEERPWLDLCLRSYTVEESGQPTVCYQIFNTTFRGADV